MKKILTLVLTCVLAFSLAGCGGSKDSSTAGSGDLSGKISLDGSTSMEKFVTALGESFKEKNPNVTVEAQFTGSSAGISSVLNGKADIGDSSRALTDEEKSQGLEENIVAIDGIAVADAVDHRAHVRSSAAHLLPRARAKASANALPPGR